MKWNVRVVIVVILLFRVKVVTTQRLVIRGGSRISGFRGGGGGGGGGGGVRSVRGGSLSIEKWIYLTSLVVIKTTKNNSSKQEIQ